MLLSLIMLLALLSSLTLLRVWNNNSCVVVVRLVDSRHQ